MGYIIKNSENIVFCFQYRK